MVLKTSISFIFLKFVFYLIDLFKIYHSPDHTATPKLGIVRIFGTKPLIFSVSIKLATAQTIKAAM